MQRTSHDPPYKNPHLPNHPWEIYRDDKLFAYAQSCPQADRIVRSMQRAYPTSQFKTRFVGKNLGRRQPEELIG